MEKPNLDIPDTYLSLTETWMCPQYKPEMCANPACKTGCVAVLIRTGETVKPTSGLPENPCKSGQFD